MSKNREQKRKEKIKQKTAVVSLAFQTNWGLKKLYGSIDDSILDNVKIELDSIQQLNLTQEILSIKVLVQEIRDALGADPVADCGDFCDSLVTLALGIGKVSDIQNFFSKTTWADKVQKKMLTIFYPDDIRNQVVAYLKTKNYNTSTYLGKPIVKFNQIYIVIERSIT